MLKPGDFTFNYLKTILVYYRNENKEMTEKEFRKWCIKWINPDHKKIDTRVYDVLVFMWKNNITWDD